MTASVQDFQARVARIEGQAGYVRPAAWGLGLAHLSTVEPAAGAGRRILDTWFPVPNREENWGAVAVLAEAAGLRGAGVAYLGTEQLDAARAAFAPFRDDGKRHANIEALDALASAIARPRAIGGVTLPRAIVLVKIRDLADKPHDAHDVYLRLHLLSHRKVRPHGQCLDGILGLLCNVAWTSQGPLDVDDLERLRLQAVAAGTPFTVNGVDKFPRLADYVVPPGVRIASAARVRLGAHLADGTTVTPSGSVSYNAGTLGRSMVEGRMSAGVTVGAGSDIGGGASVMGEMAGGNRTALAIGENSLIGANAGLGIAIGDRCTVESGLSLMAGSQVHLADGAVVAAATLAGKPDLQFRRDGQSGAIEAITRKDTTAP